MTTLLRVPILLLLGGTFCLAGAAPQSELVKVGYRETLLLRGGKSKLIKLHLELGQVVDGVAEQHGIDIQVVTFDPKGEELATFDSPNGIEGPEPFSIVAKVAGDYSIEIKPIDSSAGEGKCIFHIDRLLTAAEYVDRLIEKTYPVAIIADLAKKVRRNGSSAVDEFIASYKGKCPIVTPRSQGDGLVDVTFVFKSTPDTDQVDLNGPSFHSFSTPLERLPSTDLWFVTMAVPPNSQFRYSFRTREIRAQEVVGANSISLPVDRTGISDALSGGDKTLFKLPGAPAEPWSTKKSDVPAGKIERLSIDSAVLKEKRTLTVCSPSNWNGKDPANLVIVFDGEVYGAAPARVPTPIIIDNLCAAKKIGPTIAILVNNMGKRSRDLTCSKPFADFLATELVPWARKRYSISKDPHNTVVAGSSFGGLCATYVALQYPKVLGSVLSQSGSYWFFPQWQTSPGELQTAQEQSLIQSYFDSPKLPIHFFMEVGTFESDSMVQPNRRLRDILKLKGYPVTYREYADAHDYLTWKESLADGLIALLGK